MIFVFCRARLAALPLALSCAGLVQAQGGSAVVTLPEVVVTATRGETALLDAPAATTLVNRSDIDARNVSRVSDALSSVPSLYLSASGNGQSSSFTGNFSLRGMDAGRTLVLMDGVQPLQNAQSQRVNWQTMFSDDVQRVEVVPGGFAALYGSNAIGGVVNLIAKPLNERELTLRLKQGFDHAEGQDTRLYYRDVLESGLGFAVGLGNAVRKGYASEFAVRTPTAGAGTTAVVGAIPTTTNTGAAAYLVGDRGAQPWHQNNALLRFNYPLDAKTRVYAGLSYSDALADYTKFNSYLRNATTGAAVSTGNLNINGQRVTLTENNFLGNAPLSESARRMFLGYSGRIASDVDLKVDVARIERQSSFTSAGTTASWNAGAGTLTTAPDSGVDLSAVVNFPVGSKHGLVAGVAQHRDAVERSSFTTSNWRQPETASALRDRYAGRAQTTSLFVQDAYDAADDVVVYAGARVDRWETSGSFLRNTAPAAQAVYESRGADAFSPKLSAVWQAADPLTLRASWGRSFRAPSLFELYSTSLSSSGVTTQSAPDLRPEVGTSWELGGEWQATDAVSLRSSYYQTELTDMIYRQNVTATLVQRTNAGKTRVSGMELGATAKLGGGFVLNGNVAWIDSEVLENPGDPASIGKRLADSPGQTAFLGLAWNRGAWSANLEANYAGKVFSTSDNTDTAAGVFTAYDAFTVVNSKIAYRLNNKAELNLSFNNLLDRAYFNYSQMPRRNATLELVLHL